MTTQSDAVPGPWNPLMPGFGDLTRDVLFEDIWERPGLSKRDRSLITVAALVVLYRSDQLRGHLRRAIENGVTQEEIAEAIQHLAFYGGWPVSVNAFWVANDALGLDK